MTAADKYYLKAKDLYPYIIDDALDALDYGLSHDETHAGLLNLKGEICHRDLKQFATARECFGMALFYDPAFVDTYYNYVRLLCDLDEAQAAEKLVAKALTIKGIDKSRIWHLEALVYEKQRMYTMALASLGNALQHCQDKDRYSFYKDEEKRVKKKSKPAAKVVEEKSEKVPA